MPVILSRDQVNAIFDSSKTKKDKVIDKIENGDFDNLKVNDWYKYFVYKASNHGVKYCSSSSLLCKEKAVLKSVMANYEPALIKAMIDVAWDTKHKMMKMEEVNIFILSKSFLRTLVPLATKYMQGLINENGEEYDPRIHIDQNKELKEGGIWIAGRRVC